MVAIYDTNGSKKASYSYDAYGNCTTTNGALYDIAYNNPIRYRGYYYDRETNFYYLNSRYYNPEWRRFISPDDTAFIDSETPNGLNLYCYCNNDPVNYCDPSGHFGIWAIIGIVGTAIVFGGGTQILSNAIAGETGTDLWRGVAGAALGSGTTALALLLSPFTGGVSLVVSALLGAGMQTSVNVFETLICDEDISFSQASLDFGINFAITLAGNWLGARIIPTNNGWFRPQKFVSVFTKSYGQKILTQTAMGAGLSGMINFSRKFDWAPLIKRILFPTIPTPVLPVNLYH